MSGRLFCASHRGYALGLALEMGVPRSRLIVCQRRSDVLGHRLRLDDHVCVGPGLSWEVVHELEALLEARDRTVRKLEDLRLEMSRTSWFYRRRRRSLRSEIEKIEQEVC